MRSKRVLGAVELQRGILLTFMRLRRLGLDVEKKREVLHRHRVLVFIIKMERRDMVL